MWLADGPTRQALFATVLRLPAGDAAQAWTAPLSSPHLWLACRASDNMPVAALRCDGAEISFVVAPGQRGLGYGRRMLHAWLLTCTGRALLAYAARGNVASRRILAGAGFEEAGLWQLGGGLAPLVRFRRPANARISLG